MANFLMGRQLIENRPSWGLTLSPCPFNVVGLPNPDGFNIPGRIDIPVVETATVQAHHFSHRESQLAPPITTV
jgi:hypothetical protein